ncbi:hypothetical protein Desaci_0604 [Desulfosporosinus acidiphilus SJ4]|uniref:DUF1858 domain-containing protein n=1 Tax=Desulfosporosinus acidiphilus (strain DSM 22704 / JCM 16185 / SJ4) TaxID=646529 RepID=I4D1J2_DESAJ|nr:hypothetical protein Desaci_0604 [Desulfosporosinus acidiphilus SJ4]
MDNLNLKTNISEILSLYPQTLTVFRKFGISVSG